MQVDCSGPDRSGYALVKCLDCENEQYEPTERGDKIGWGCRRCGHLFETNLEKDTTEPHLLSTFYQHAYLTGHPWGETRVRFRRKGVIEN